MSFEDTYAHEVLRSRQVRAQRAGFWAKVVSLVLMITIAATLHSEPRLRSALMQAGISAVMQMRGQAPAAPPTQPGPTSPDVSMIRDLMQKMQASHQSPSAPSDAGSDPASAQPRDAVKVNRYGGSSSPTKPVFQRAPTAPPGPVARQDRVQDTQQMADELGKLLQNIRVGQ